MDRVAGQRKYEFGREGYTFDLHRASKARCTSTGSGLLPGPVVCSWTLFFYSSSFEAVRRIDDAGLGAARSYTGSEHSPPSCTACSTRTNYRKSVDRVLSLLRSLDVRASGAARSERTRVIVDRPETHTVAHSFTKVDPRCTSTLQRVRPRDRPETWADWDRIGPQRRRLRHSVIVAGSVGMIVGGPAMDPPDLAGIAARHGLRLVSPARVGVGARPWPKRSSTSQSFSKAYDASQADIPGLQRRSAGVLHGGTRGRSGPAQPRRSAVPEEDPGAVPSAVRRVAPRAGRTAHVRVQAVPGPPPFSCSRADLRQALLERLAAR